MNKLLVLLAVVVVAVRAAKTSDDRASLLKRLLDVLEEKRSMNVFMYDGKTLKVSFTVCVRGDKSKQPCKSHDGVRGHTLHVFDDDDNEVFQHSEKYMEGYGGPYGKYEMTMLKDGQHYEIWACETYEGEKKGDKDVDYECNKGDVTAGTSQFGFGGRVYNPVENRVRNQNTVRK